VSRIVVTFAAGAVASVLGFVQPVQAAGQINIACPGRDMMTPAGAPVADFSKSVKESAKGLVNGKARLWKIEHEDYPDRIPSYLLGIVNVADPRINELSPAVEEALGKTRRIALESDIISSNRVQEVVGSMRGSAFLPKGQSLGKLLSASDVAKIVQAAKRRGLEPEQAARLKPFIATLLLASSDCQQRQSRTPGFDNYLADFAERRGVGAFGLESLDMMFESLAKLKEETQIALLKATLKGYDSADDVSETMVQLYLKRDMAGLNVLGNAVAKAHGASAAAIDEYTQIMIVDRNIRMRDRAIMHIAYGGVFIAVGAAHLPGPAGLVEQFREAGYTVTEVE